MRRLGARVRRRESDPHARDAGMRSLTERERDVAELVGRGHTNREIAATIFVSEKSVERYVSRIFTKLGVSRRTELALRVAAELAATAESPLRRTTRPEVEARVSPVGDCCAASRLRTDLPGVS